MDSWVERREEGISYKRTDYVRKILRQYGLDWFNNSNNEIMVKYGIFPQKLVGYYLCEERKILKYVINRHYVDEWERNRNFKIGDYIYFEQIVDFDRLGPYNTVYEYRKGRYSILDRRWKSTDIL